MTTKRYALVILAAALLLWSRDAAAELTPMFHVETGAATLLTDRYTDKFDFGFHVNARFGLRVAGPLSVQIATNNMWFPVDGEEMGTLNTVQGGLRIWYRLNDGEGRLGGPYIDANAGVGFTGDLLRFVFDVGIGWDFTVTRWFALGPNVRYLQIVQPNDANVPDDGYFIVFGLGLTFSIPRRQAAPPPTVEPAVDTDGDHITDDVDRCPETPEDMDSFEDDDGCPDLDNDDDGFPDADDRCPRSPENRNGFEDDDGCPDELPPPPPIMNGPEPPADNFRDLEPRVLFRTGSSRVDQAQHAEIERVAEIMRANPGRRLRVVGHADERGSAAFNQMLSAGRAGGVAQLLIIRGVDPNDIEVMAVGATRRECQDHTAECHTRNRRVIFRLSTD